MELAYRDERRTAALDHEHVSEASSGDLGPPISESETDRRQRPPFGKRRSFDDLADDMEAADAA